MRNATRPSPAVVNPANVASRSGNKEKFNHALNQSRSRRRQV